MIGRLSELHPDFVENGRAAILDLDLELLQKLTPTSASYQLIRRFPSSAFDLSVIAPARDLAGALHTRIVEFGGSLIENVEYVREYQGPPVPEGCKSVTFRVTAGDPARTLTNPDITELRSAILNGLANLGYDTRV
jgi:phenylalanyl-tRNA synthetase beta chain